ncbi:MAG: hypothetical protein WKF68_00270 [Daejeonella sp.]
MEQTNYQESNQKVFSDHIHDPSGVSSEHVNALESLTEIYPYSQLLRAFYTRSLIGANPALFEKELIKAALYSPNRSVLRTIIKEAELLKYTPADQLSGTEPGIEIVSLTQDVANTSDNTDSTASQVEGQSSEEKLDNVVGGAEVYDEVQIIEPLNEGYPGEDQYPIEEGDSDLTENVSPETDVEEQGDNIDAILIETELDSADENSVDETQIPADDDELDIHLKQNAVAADYLKAEDVYLSETTFQAEIEISEDLSPESAPNDQQKVSKYDDDKLPYSFLWWLSRTRKEHSENYQPYLSFHLDTSQSIRRNNVDQLSTQIIENIFHLQSPVDQLKDAPRTVPFQVKRKEDYILEKFIREEPQIKAPDSGKLDNENKARKSAEDPNDLVSETLANIYTDQMLFHKAIDSYKKLSLKFPEKSTYFADQIRELEKKIN